MKRIFSGIQPSGPSGILHLGNYLGAIKQWVELQNGVDPESSSGRTQCVFCVVDLHAITVSQKSEELRRNILSVAAWYLAAGIDSKKSIIFVQSTRPEHTELAWILNCQTSMGELGRMTQFKDKAGANQERVSAGLFDYPVLMAADILLYRTNFVPVGEDQKQHVELARDLALRFNKKYGEVFTIPAPLIKKSSARVMGLDDPTKKMSKSAESALNYIALDNSPDEIRQKIKRAVTDSGNEIKTGPDKPALTNLLNIYSEITGKTIIALESEFKGRGYGEFKGALADELIDYLNPIQTKYEKIMADKASLVRILEDGSERAQAIASKTLSKAQKVIGLGI